MERVQSQLGQDQAQLERLKIQMKQAERTELRAEQLWLIQQGYGMCAELEGLLAGYQGIVDEGKSPARKCALLILRKIQDGLRGWEAAVNGLAGESNDALTAENARIREGSARLKQIADGKTALLQTLKMQLRNHRVKCLNEAFQKIDTKALAACEGEPERQKQERRLRERKRILEFENGYRRIKAGMRELRRRADIAGFADDAFGRIDRALEQLRERDPDPAALHQLEIYDVQPLANRMRKYEKDARALDEELSRHLAVYDALCEETGLRPVDAFPFREESIQEIDAACDQLLHSAEMRIEMETDGAETIRTSGFASAEAPYERYRNWKRKYREI